MNQNTKKLLLVSAPLLLLSVFGVLSLRSMAFNASVDDDFSTIGEAVEMANDGRRVILSLDQVPLDDEVRYRQAQRSYTYKPRPGGSFQLCAAYYKHVWSIKANDVRCRSFSG